MNTVILEQARSPGKRRQKRSREEREAKRDVARRKTAQFADGKQGSFSKRGLGC